MAKLYFSVDADYQKVIRLREEIAKLEKQMKGFNSHTTTDAIDKLEDELSDLRSEYNKLTKEAAKSGVEIEKSGISMKKALAAVGGVAALKALGSEIIRVRGEFQEMETSIETLVGKSMSNKLIPQLKELAKVSPLTMTDIVGAEKMMLGFNIEADKTIGFLKALSDVSMGSSQKFNSLTLAFSQMSASGKLMGQDLNQMINAGFNPLQQIAKTTGKSIATLKEEMSKGAVSAEMVQQAFIDATSAGGKFYKMSENASKTINGQISMMQDAWDAALNEMGQNSEGFIMSGIQTTTTLIQNYETVGKVLVSLVATYGVYKAALIANIALEKVQAIQRLASIKGVKQMKLVTDMLNTRLTKLNAKLMANPYAILAGVVVSLGVAIYQSATKMTYAEMAVKKYNDAINEQKELEEKRKTALEELLSVLSDESASSYAKIQAMNRIRDEYPALIQKYIDEKGHVKDLVGLWKEYNEEIEKNRKESNLNRLVEANAELEKRKANLDNASNMTNAERREAAKNAYKAAQEAQKVAQKAVDEDNFIEWQKNLKKKTDAQIDAELLELKRIESARKNNKNMRMNSVGVGGYNGIITDEELSKSIEVLNSESELRKQSKSNFDKDYQEAKAAWEKAKKELKKIEANRKAYTTKEYEDAKKKVDSTEAAYKKLGGKTEKQLKQEETANEKKIKEEQKLADELLDIRRKNQQDEIDLLEEGSEKRLKQIELDYQKELDAIEKQKREWEGKQEKGLSDEQRDALNQRTIIAEKNKAKAILQIEKELVGQYQSNAQKRLEIEEKFNKDIAALQLARVEAEKRGDNEAVKKLSESLAKAGSDKGKALMSYDLEVLKQTPEYIQAFEDLDNTSTETLQFLVEQFEKVKESAAESLTPEALREYTTTMEELWDKINSRNPFEAIIKYQKEAAITSKELADAQSRLNKIQNGEKVLKSSYIDKETGKIVNVYWELEEAIEAVRKAKDKDSKATNKQKKAEKEASEIVEKLANSLKEVGDTIGGTAGQCISLIGDIASFANMCMIGTSQVSQTASKAIQAVEKASVILGIISAAIQILQKISELGNNKAFKEYEAYAEKVKEINALTDAVNEYKIAVLEAQKEENNWFSTNNLKELRDYKAIQQEALKAYKDKLGEEQAIYQNESGGGWLTGAFNWAMGNLSALSPFDWWKDIWGQGGYEEGMTAAANNLRIETRKKSSGFLGSGIGAKSQKTEDLQTWINQNKHLFEDLDTNLFDENGFINIELAKLVIDNYGDKLVGETEETLQELIELKEKYDEYITQLREYVSSMYEPLVDNFVDSLWTWFDEGKDALDTFKDYASDTFRDIVSDMLRTIVLEKVVGSFSDDIADIYEEYAKGAIDETELMKKVGDRTEGLVDSYETQIPALQAIMEQVEAYLNQAGISLHGDSSYSQEASSKGFETMSEETGSELNGRFTALQISNEETKNQITLLNITANEIKAIQSGIKDISSGIQDQLANSYLELVAINENTGTSAKYLKDIKFDIAEVKENTKKL